MNRSLPPIRAARADDAHPIARVESESSDTPWSAGKVAGSLALATTRAWVASPEKEPPCAHLLATSTPPEGEILIVAVAPAWRRRGLARRLVETAQEAFRAEGVREAFLEVRADNGAARALYAATGWNAIASRQAYYADGADALVLRWCP